MDRNQPIWPEIIKQERHETNQSGQKPFQHTVRKQTHTARKHLNKWLGSKDTQEQKQ